MRRRGRDRRITRLDPDRRLGQFRLIRVATELNQILLADLLSREFFNSANLLAFRGRGNCTGKAQGWRRLHGRHGRKTVRNSSSDIEPRQEVLIYWVQRLK